MTTYARGCFCCCCFNFLVFAAAALLLPTITKTKTPILFGRIVFRSSPCICCSMKKEEK